MDYENFVKDVELLPFRATGRMACGATYYSGGESKTLYGFVEVQK